MTGLAAGFTPNMLPGFFFGLISLSQAFGLAHPDSVSNLVRRAKLRIDKSREYRQAIEYTEFNLGLNTENLT